MLTSTRRPPAPRRRSRRRRILTRALPVFTIAIIAFAIGIALALQNSTDARQVVARYVALWSKSDYPSMYALLDKVSRTSISEAQFAAVIERDASIATETAIRPLRILDERNAVFRVRMSVDTHVFGVLTEILQVATSGSGDTVHVHLTPISLFPGLLGGETLSRTTTMPARGTILAADGEVLAQGPDRTSPIPGIADQIVGKLGPIPDDQRAKYTALGYPPDAEIGTNGLEAVFQRRLGGRPGGTLKAGSRVLASDPAVPGKTVHTTIVPAIEQAAVDAIGSNYAGMTVINPKSGGIEAAVGIAFSDVQPPGSTMKIITSAAALTAGIAKISSVYAYSSSATLDGYDLQNAGGENCGGTLINAFAVSCNSVFAPLGAQVGGARLVAMAERFGFNSPVKDIPTALESTIPSAATIGDSLAVGSSAIGQGMVLASSLEMTDVAATVADNGRRPLPTFAAHVPPRFVRAITPAVAGDLRQMMEAVVEYGTGTSAQISGVQVAGKTGTAELTTTQGPGAQNNPNASSAQNTDAWFVGFAPAGAPKVVVGALFPNQGAGGDTAAPAVRAVIEAALAQ